MTILSNQPKKYIHQLSKCLYQGKRNIPTVSNSVNGKELSNTNWSKSRLNEFDIDICHNMKNTTPTAENISSRLIIVIVQ